MMNQILSELPSSSEQLSYQWPQKFSPKISELPALIERELVKLMNLERENDWRKFAQLIGITSQTIEGYKQQGGMEKVMNVWKTEGGTTKELFNILNHLQRMDVLQRLEELSR